MKKRIGIALIVIVSSCSKDMDLMMLQKEWKMGDVFSTEQESLYIN